MKNSTKKCQYCSEINEYNKIYLNSICFCSYKCVDQYIKKYNGIQINCFRCNKLFMRKFLGSHIIDIHGNIHIFCSIKCQFKK